MQPAKSTFAGSLYTRKQSRYHCRRNCILESAQVANILFVARVHMLVSRERRNHMTFKLTRKGIPTVEVGLIIFKPPTRYRTFLLLPKKCTSRRWTDTALNVLSSYGKTSPLSLKEIPSLSVHYTCVPFYFCLCGNYSGAKAAVSEVVSWDHSSS